MSPPTNAASKVVKAVTRKALNTPRAVSIAEAKMDSVEPNRKPSEETMMPWKGWFQSYMKENFPIQFEKVRNFFLFMPDDITDLQQQASPNTKIPISKDDPTMTHMYRYPSPGSQKAPRMPNFEEGFQPDPYDSGYFKRDTRRRNKFSELGDTEVEKAKLQFMNPDDPAVQEEKQKVLEGPTESSVGNKGVFATGPSDFDPTGLRATMSVTWGALEKSLDSHMPNHMPTPVWVGKEKEILDWHEKKDLPVPVGGYYQALKVPTNRRIARW